MRARAAPILLALLHNLSACTQRIEAVEPKTPDSASAGRAATRVGAPDVPWSKKTHEQRGEYMAHVVYPKVKALFQEYDPKEFAEFRCQTCHGEDMEKVHFEMPNSLFALPRTDPVKAALSHDEKTAKFMMESVEPTMKELLGREDPATTERFGCLSCHQTEK